MTSKLITGAGGRRGVPGAGGHRGITGAGGRRGVRGAPARGGLEASVTVERAGDRRGAAGGEAGA
ncbi:MAG: hypothetical protein ABIY55_16395 [Kofleriaceae bacterium]